MMGHRGCRLAVTYPEIAEMQTRAVIEAAINVSRKNIKVVPEIMIPLVGDVKELKYVKDVVVRTANELIEKSGVKIEYKVGTMIEIPRAAITADEIAKEAEFFSFGTNDLTQMTLDSAVTMQASSLKNTTTRRYTSSILLQNWIRMEWGNWLKWLRSLEDKQDRILSLVYAVNMAEIRRPLSSATKLG